MTFLYNQYKALDASRALVSLPLKSIYHEPDTVNLLNDGTMEALDFAAWTLANNPTATKETASPPPGSVRYAKIAFNGTANPGMLQPCLTVGKQYRIRGKFRSSGLTARILGGFDQILLATSVTPLTWTPFDIVFIPSGANIQFYSFGGVAGYVEWDDVTIVAELSKTPNIGSLGGGALLGVDGFTPASMPTLVRDNGLKYDGSDDVVTLPNHPSLSFTAGGGVDLPFSLEALVRNMAVATMPIIVKGAYATTMEYAFYIFSAGSGVVTFNVSNPTWTGFLARTWDVGLSFMSDGAVHHWVATYDGSKTISGLAIYMDGVRRDNSSVVFGAYTGMTAGPAGLSVGHFPNIGRLTGVCNDAKVWPWALTPAQIKFRAERARAEMRIR